MTDAGLAALAALPWVAIAAVFAWRGRDSRSLDAEPAEPPPNPPLVSVVIPARNERRNIERCLRSVLATTWPRLEVIVVDDHSDDGTGDLARAVAAGDPRVQVIDNPPLPAGWFGKPWACLSGARAARGMLLCFTDADTRHAPDLLTRSVNALRARDADLLSVGGRQEMETLAERLVQPQVFNMMLGRYGGTEVVNRSPHVHDKIANGQYILVRRAAYEAVGGHAAVHDQVAEDLMIAQRMFAAGHRVCLVLGLEQLSTRMYASLGEVVRGWSKNLYAGSRETLPPIPAVRVLHPLLLLAYPVLQLAPPVGLVTALAVGATGAWLLWAAATTLLLLLWWLAVYWLLRLSPLHALLFPVGGALVLYILLRAIGRGRRVAWKGRDYVAP